MAQTLRDGSFAAVNWTTAKLIDNNTGDSGPKYFAEQRASSPELGPGNPVEYRNI